MSGAGLSAKEMGMVAINAPAIIPRINFFMVVGVSLYIVLFESVSSRTSVVPGGRWPYFTAEEAVAWVLPRVERVVPVSVLPRVVPAWILRRAVQVSVLLRMVPAWVLPQAVQASVLPRVEPVARLSVVPRVEPVVPVLLVSVEQVAVLPREESVRPVVALAVPMR